MKLINYPNLVFNNFNGFLESTVFVDLERENNN